MKRQLRRVTRQRIGPSGRAALQLLACCPRVPTDVVGVLLGMGHTRSAAQLLLRLRTAGLAHYKTVRPGPMVGPRSVRLWTLTTAGHAIVSPRGLAPSSDERAHLQDGKPEHRRDAARQRDVPMQIVVYRLLARIVGSLDRPMRITPGSIRGSVRSSRSMAVCGMCDYRRPRCSSTGEWLVRRH